MLAYIRVDDFGVAFPSDYAMKTAFERIERGKPISIHIDLKSKRVRISKKRLKNKIVISNTNYAIIYGEVVAYMFESNGNKIVIKPNNTTNKIKKDIQYFTSVWNKKKQLLAVIKKTFDYSYIYVNGEYGEYLIILRKSKFNPLSCDVSAFLKDEKEIASDWRDLFEVMEYGWNR